MTATSQWLTRAVALQRYVGYDIPLDRLTLTATHNSFSHDYDISTHANFEVQTAQIFSITDQLSCLGVRGLELDLHYIGELAEEGDEESAIRLCHASSDVAEQISELCEESFGWDICNEADIFDYSEDTGCRPGAPTARSGFEEVAAWLNLEENANEVVFIKLDGSLNDEDERVSTLVADVFGDAAIFSPASWDAFSGSDGWPSPAEMVALGTRVLIAGSEPSTLVFSTDTDAVEVLTSALNFDGSECDGVDGFPEPSWHRVQGDMVQYQLKRGASTIFELIPEDEEALLSGRVDNVMNCGQTPTFDRLDAELLEATVWSWATDRPETGFTDPRAAVVSVDGGRWTDVDSNSEAGARHSYACRNSDDDFRFDWIVVAVDATGSAASSRRRNRNRNRRRLETTDSGTDDGGDVEFSEFSGEFANAEEACESEGYVFGGPRTAYENARLREVMEAAGVETAWINHTSQGDGLGNSLCWTLEGGSEYCVDVPDDTCSAEPEEPTEEADGQLPDFQVGDWEDEDYVRPNYTISPTVERFHNWVRVSGDNEFDLEENEYVVGIILSAVPVFVFGFIVACCCLPVGHIAAGSKQHHVNGSGFFGCFCPSRCKRGDFMGSGTLGVVVFFTLVTIIGAAMAIYGVRSVDSDITNMVDSLQEMGKVMVDSQSGVENIYGLLGNVQESFEAVSSCSLLSSLEGVSAGIDSAREAVEVVIEDDELGSVGEDILSLEQAFSETGATRRAIVYLAGALVLLMSVVYVSVGCYALRKDGGNGKAGGARMTGPVTIGCLILPFTLMVILLCWFLFGGSTSVALLTSDFCVDPTAHTVEAFKEENQEIVDYYTSCEGENTFSDQLATAYLQGSTALDLLDGIEPAEFAATCPDDVAGKEVLDDDINAILTQIDTLGYLVQCSRINPYYVDGIEDSICTDAPGDIWFVIVGFAVVSVGLFVVAVSFRLLLQQKEEGLYKVVFEDELAPSVASSSDYEDSRHGRGGAGGGAASGRNVYPGGGSKRSQGSGGGARVQQSSSPPTLPGSSSPTPPRFGGGHGVAAVSVSSWGHPNQTNSKPVELAVPLSRSPVVAGRGNVGRGGGGGVNPPVFASNGSSSEDEDWRRAGGGRGGQHAATAATAAARARGSGRAGSAASTSRGRSGRRSSNGRSGHHHHEDFQSGRSSRLFRTLAGLDDPAEEAPSVIVSRYAAQTRNLGGAGGEGRRTSAGSGSGERLTYTFGRASSVVGSRRSISDHNDGSDLDNDFSDDDFGITGTGGQRRRGEGEGRGSGGRSSVESGSAAANPLGESGRKKSGRLSVAAVVPPPPDGTWAAFSRNHAPDLSSSAEFRSGSGGNQRRSSGGRGRGQLGQRRSPRGSVDGSGGAPGYDGGGAPPGSSTVSGLTGWRRQRLQQQRSSQRSSQPAARESKIAHGSEGRATRSGVKGLSALSRPAPAEASKNTSTRMAAVTGTSGGSVGLSASGRSGGGGGGVSSSGSGSSRPGTSVKDALRGRGGAGGGGRR